MLTQCTKRPTNFDEIHFIFISSVPSTIFEPFGVCKNVNNNARSEEIVLKLSFAEKNYWPSSVNLHFSGSTIIHVSNNVKK